MNIRDKVLKVIREQKAVLHYEGEDESLADKIVGLINGLNEVKKIETGEIKPVEFDKFLTTL